MVDLLKNPPRYCARVTQVDSFDIVIHYGGHFVYQPTLTYVGGRVKKLKNIDPDLLSSIEIRNMVKDLKYNSSNVLWWKVPGQTLIAGRRPLGNDQDVIKLVEAVKGHAYIDVFVEHLFNENAALEDVPLLTYSASHDVENDKEVDDDYVEVEVKIDSGQVERDCYEVQVEEANIKVNREGDEAENKVDTDDEGGRSDTNLVDSDYEDYWECEDLNETEMEIVEEEAVPSAYKAPIPEVDDAIIEDEVVPDWTDEDIDSEELVSPDVSEEEDNEMEDESKKVKQPKFPRFPRFKMLTDGKLIKFKIGLDFATKNLAKDAVRDYGLCQSKPVWIDKDDKKRLVVRCREGCPFYMRISLDTHRNVWQVRRVDDIHTCPRQFKNPQAKTKLLGKKYMDKLREDPNLTSKQIQRDAKKEWGVHLSRGQAYRAKRKAIELVEGTLEDQYNNLRSYGMELIKSNKGSSVFLVVSRPRPELLPIFQRMYVCFDGCKKAFMECCRPLIGLDGCFLKGVHGGQLLAAVGVDGNNQMFPIAFAVVEAEVKDSWQWFVNNLVNDLRPIANHRWSFLSDQQKGLDHAISALREGIEHRFCVKHLYANFKKKYPGDELKSIMWEAARATNEAEFQIVMKELKKIDGEAFQHIMNKYPPYQWSRSAFSTHTKCHLQVNNLCEAFNKSILEFRDKPIIHLVEGIRLYLMDRIIKNRKRIMRYHGTICPRPQKILEKAKIISDAWTPIWSGDEQGALFEVEKKPNKYVVNLVEKTCSCRLWDLTGIPCCHSVAAMAYCNHKPEDYVNQFYSKEMYLQCYKHIIYPTNGPKLWPKTKADPIQPPQIRRHPGRPKKMRNKNPDERPKDPNKLPRHHSTYRCTRCKKFGHNIRSCRGKTRADREILVGGNKASQKQTSNSCSLETITPIAKNQYASKTTPTFSTSTSKIVQSNKKASGESKFIEQQKTKSVQCKGIPYVTKETLQSISEGSKKRLTGIVTTQESQVKDRRNV